MKSISNKDMNSQIWYEGENQLRMTQVYDRYLTTLEGSKGKIKTSVSRQTIACEKKKPDIFHGKNG